MRLTAGQAAGGGSCLERVRAHARQCKGPAEGETRNREHDRVAEDADPSPRQGIEGRTDQTEQAQRAAGEQAAACPPVPGASEHRGREQQRQAQERVAESIDGVQHTTRLDSQQACPGNVTTHDQRLDHRQLDDVDHGYERDVDRGESDRQVAPDLLVDRSGGVHA
ncbi:MAG: hypothetical protein QOE99_1559, partial [Actinomycetota bacterium]|nr:hypothetical protein [Actinomycetota bacterium]